MKKKDKEERQKIYNYAREVRNLKPDYERWLLNYHKFMLYQMKMYEKLYKNPKK